jgi:chitinase
LSFGWPARLAPAGIDVVKPIMDTAPTAIAGVYQSVVENTLVTLDGAGSYDPEGEAVTYAWSQVTGRAVTLIGANTASTRFTAPDVAESTTLLFKLEVCDEPDPTSLCDADSVMVTVRPSAAS